jgi:hypothetical protein
MKRFIALVGAVIIMGMPWGALSVQPAVPTAIISGPLAKLDIKDAQIEPGHAKPQGA